MSWRDAFTAYTTGWAFQITLSHDMASLLAHIGAGQPAGTWESRSGRGSFIPTFRSLERRGLAEHNPVMALPSSLPRGVTAKWIYRLTPAGERVLELLRMAGIEAAAHVSTEAAA